LVQSITAGTYVTELSRSEEHPDTTRPHGELVRGEALWMALGYRTRASFRQAAHRKTVPIHVFDLPSRRGKHAFRAALDAWVSELVYREGKNASRGNYEEASS
jgi:hypothetical protein